MKITVNFALLAIGIAGCQGDSPTSVDTRKISVETPIAARDGNPVQKVETADDEETHQSDHEITARIQEQLVIKKMSENVQGVTIVTQSGRVALRGMVKTAEEKKQLEEIARSIAGTDNVWSRLEVE